MAHKTGSPTSRFDEFVNRLSVAVGHADRVEPLRAYLTGLLLSGERKSVEPMAAKVDPRPSEPVNTIRANSAPRRTGSARGTLRERAG